jgi:hypothetical protein
MADISFLKQNERYVTPRAPKLVGWRLADPETPDVNHVLCLRASRGDATLTEAFREYLCTDLRFEEHFIPQVRTTDILSRLLNSHDVVQLLSVCSESAGTDGSEDDELVAAISALHGLLKDRAFTVIDVIFSFTDIARVRTSILIALLRTTFAVREKLSSWGPLLSRVRTELGMRHLDSDRLLKGL